MVAILVTRNFPHINSKLLFLNNQIVSVIATVQAHDFKLQNEL